QIETEVDQRADSHVAAYAREAVEIERAHNSSWESPGSASPACRSILPAPRPLAERLLRLPWERRRSCRSILPAPARPWRGRPLAGSVAKPPPSKTAAAPLPPYLAASRSQTS